MGALTMKNRLFHIVSDFVIFAVVACGLLLLLAKGPGAEQKKTNPNVETRERCVIPKLEIDGLEIVHKNGKKYRMLKYAIHVTR